MNPTVSLLVPVFNRAELLVPCLESALAQTMSNLEVVVVDGASTDGTWEVCMRYAAADPRVRIFRDAVNTGPVRGWWRCLEEARGIYATFLWSDDMVKPTFLASTLPVLRDSDTAFVFTAVEVGAEPGQGGIAYAHPSGSMPSREFIERSLAGTEFPVSPACALFRLGDLRKSFTMELPTEPRTDLTTTGAGADVLLLLLTALRYARVARISEPLAFFRTHPSSITVDGRGGQVALDYALTKGWFGRTNGFPELAGDVFARHWLHEMRTSRRFVNPWAASRRYRHLVAPTELITAASVLLGRRGRSAAAARTRRRSAVNAR